MHDIAAQCGASTRRNVTAMSECIVAESEARAEVLSRWDKLSDASAEKCLKLGTKAKTNKKYPYSTLAKCVAVEPLVAPTEGAPVVAPVAEAPTGAVSPSGRSLVPSWIPKWTGLQKSDATPTR